MPSDDHTMRIHSHLAGKNSRNAKPNGDFELIDSALVFDKESTNKIKTNYIKTMMRFARMQWYCAKLGMPKDISSMLRNRKGLSLAQY